MTYDQLEAAIGYVFTDRSLLHEALTHRSWLKERQDRGGARDQRDQQRLEYLGDAFLGYEVARALFEQFPQATEEELTKRRRDLVQGRNLQALGLELGLLELVRVGLGEQANLGKNKKVVEDTVEALIGAVLVDANAGKAAEVVWTLVLTRTPPEVEVNPISAFNEAWQAIHGVPPPKPLYDPTGPPHRRTWNATLQLPNGRVITGEGTTKQEANREIYASALKLLNKTPPS